MTKEFAGSRRNSTARAMSSQPPTNIYQYFGDVNDPRGQNVRHPLLSIIIIAICGTLCGADNWVDIEMYGQAKQDWLSTFLDLPHGIPSHDTFGRVFRQLDPDEFQQSFHTWTMTICELTQGEVVAIDGKHVRRSKDGVLGKEGIHMVSVWASENQLVLGQEKVDDHSNEITAIPKLLHLLDLTGSIVTIDAIGCQTEIAQTIIDQHADYVCKYSELIGQKRFENKRDILHELESVNSHLKMVMTPFL